MHLLLHKSRKLPRLFGALAAISLTASCGGSGGADGGGHDAMGHDTGAATFEFGEPGDREDADRTIEVAALDSLEFEPERLTVDAGETVTFEVTNEGRAPHEFVIGDRAYQEEHEQQMSEGAEHDLSAGNIIELDPGADDGITWTFSEAGDVLFACHVENHYAGGMFGTIEVVES
jgi:uncharacterized cupredoxin-like copper-binding protein